MLVLVSYTVDGPIEQTVIGKQLDCGQGRQFISDVIDIELEH